MTTNKPISPELDELTEDALDHVNGGTHEVSHTVQQGGPKTAAVTTERNETDLTFVRR